MRLVRVTQKSFIGGRIVEAGEELLVDDSVAPAPHIIDVAAEARGEPPMEPDQRDPNAGVFRSELAHNIEAAGGPFVRSDAHPAVVATVAAAQERQRQEAEAAEQKRIADEAEAKRIADEAEADRLAAEQKRLADEVEAKRLADEAAEQHQTSNPESPPGSQGSGSTAGE